MCLAKRRSIQRDKLQKLRVFAIVNNEHNTAHISPKIILR